jgi:hypothetical protein
MEKNPSLATNILSFSKNFFTFFETDIFYRFDESASVVSMSNQKNPFYTNSFYTLNINFNIILELTQLTFK